MSYSKVKLKNRGSFQIFFANYFEFSWSDPMQRCQLFLIKILSHEKLREVHIKGTEVWDLEWMLIVIIFLVSIRCYFCWLPPRRIYYNYFWFSRPFLKNQFFNYLFLSFGDVCMKSYIKYKIKNLQAKENVCYFLKFCRSGKNWKKNVNNATTKCTPVLFRN